MSLLVGRVVGGRRGQLEQFKPFEGGVKRALLRMGYTILDIDCLKSFANQIYLEE